MGFRLLLALPLLAFALHSSQCQYPPRLIYWAELGINSNQHWYMAAGQGNSYAKEQLLLALEQNPSDYWLKRLAQLQSPEAQFQLAQNSSNSKQQLTWLRKAAQSGHLEAMYEMSLLAKDTQSRLYWLRSAAEQEYKPAQVALYHWYWQQQDYQEALPWLRHVAKADGDAALQLARYLWQTRQPDAALSWFEQAAGLGNSEANQYLQLIKTYWRKPFQVDASRDVLLARQNDFAGEGKGEPCQQQLQFIATSLESLRQAVTTQQQFNADKRLQNLPICINPPLWLDDGSLKCSNRATDNYRLKCDLTALAQRLTPEGFSHLVIFAKQGKANVHNGVMYLDQADSYSVFVHELAHFVGFVDEYPLSEGMAEQQCISNASPPNLLLRHNLDPETLWEPELTYWQAFGEPLRLSKARTCNNHPAQAYKFSDKLTFMEYHDQAIIPPIYRKIWRARLLSNQGVYPAALNIAQALELEGRSGQALVWWQRYNRLQER